LTQEVHALLAAQFEGFAGNAEGNDILVGKFDCIVTDGFTGNVVLKTTEGSVHMLLKELKKVLTSSFIAKLGAALVKSKLAKLKEAMSADTYGGAPLLGLNNVVIIGHGSSNATAVANAIRVAARTIRARLPEVIEEAIAAAAKPIEASNTKQDEDTTAPRI
ncbi:MAG: phosphate--acyl-ACP acyltransferase, partial [Coriobacteriia bacterium]|nr:phosphate--acyl-ACP acyltransferase [Coriobacteriia bacterium]